MSRRYGRLLAATLAAALTVGMAGCGNDDDKKEASTGNGGKIEDVTWITAFGAVGRDALIWVGIEKGYYKEAGYNVKVELGAGADANMTKMVSGQAQFGSMDMTAVMVAAGTGKFKGIKGIGTIHQQTLVSIVAPTDGTVKAPKDLEGKTVGMPAATVNQMLFPAYAKLAGIDASKVTIQNVAANQIAASLGGASPVAAVSTFLISVGGIETATKKKMTVMPYSDYLRDLYGNHIVVNEEYAKKNPEGTKRFRDATLKALKWTIENPKEAADIMAKAQPAANPGAALSEIKLMTPYVTSTQGGSVFGEVSKDRATRAIAILQGAGLIQPGLTPEQVMDFDLAPKA